MSVFNHEPDPFIALPFRKTDKDAPEWRLCTEYVIRNHHSNFNSTIENAFKQMSTLHNVIAKVSGSSDPKNAPTESYIDRTLKEHCKLLAMAQAHLPMYGREISKKFEFYWRDSFDDTKTLSSNSNLELVSCVYNIAASYCTIAVNQTKTGSVEGVKSAFTNFQNAAGYYAMTQQLSSRLPADYTQHGDLRHDSLSMLTQLCAAQAHHCGYLKAEDAVKGNPQLLSKIAAEAAKQYEDAHSKMKNSCWYTGKGGNAKEVEMLLYTLTQVFYARAHMHMASKYEADSETGTAIAHYLRAKDYLSKLPKLPTQALVSWVNSIVNCANDAHGKAVEMNTSVFFSRIPPSVPTPEGLARPLGQVIEHRSLTKFESTRGVDPFFGIIPTHISDKVRRWRDQQNRLIKVSTDAADKSHKTVQDKLNQLDVRMIVARTEAETNGKGGVPEPLRDNILKLQAEAVSRNSDTSSILIESINSCDQINQVVADRLKEVEEELRNEQQIEEPYVREYGEKMWRAVHPASMQTPDFHAITAAIEKYKTELANSVSTPFMEARKRCETNLRDLARLSWSMTDLDSLMPFVESPEGKEQKRKVKELTGKLRALLEKIDSIHKEQLESRKQLVDLVESDNVTFELSATSSGEHEMVLANASKQITDVINEVNEQTREEAALLEDVSSNTEELAVLQSTDPNVQQAGEVAHSLENACTTYKELCATFQQCAECAQNILTSVETLLGNAKSFALSRRLQAEDTAKTLDEHITHKANEIRQAESALLESQRRQEEIRKQIAALESRKTETHAQAVASNMYGGMPNANNTAPTALSSTEQFNYNKPPSQPLVSQQQQFMYPGNTNNNNNNNNNNNSNSTTTNGINYATPFQNSPMQQQVSSTLPSMFANAPMNNYSNNNYNLPQVQAQSSSMQQQQQQPQPQWTYSNMSQAAMPNTLPQQPQQVPQGMPNDVYGYHLGTYQPRPM